MECLSATSEKSASQQLWLMLHFKPTSLFSLRMTHATNKGGRTLLLPTPYAFKLALVDAAFRAWPPAEAPGQARVLFKTVAPLTVRFSPPKEAVVQHTFIKVRQEERDSRPGLYNSTITFREFVYYLGTLIGEVSATLQPTAAAGRRALFQSPSHRGSVCNPSRKRLISAVFAHRTVHTFSQTLVLQQIPGELRKPGGRRSSLPNWAILSPRALRLRIQAARAWS